MESNSGHTHTETPETNLRCGIKELGRQSGFDTTGMEKLHERLTNAGVTGYRFVRDEDFSVDICLGDYDEKKESASSPPSSDAVVEVKTLVWEAVLVRPKESGIGTMEEIIDHYFVTALRTEDRVDIRHLSELVRSHTLRAPVQERRDGVDVSLARLVLRLAERSVAEGLTGFVSGTMPPVLHSTPMVLFLDDIVARGRRTISGGISDRPWYVASVGSGAAGHSLHISISDILRIAETSSSVHISSVSLRDRRGGSSDDRSASFSNAKESTAVVNRGNQPYVGAGYATETEMARTFGKQARARLLRNTAKRKGSADELRHMIAEVGDEFPSLMQVERDRGGVDKNALHFAAWKGDVESITLLIDAGKTFGLDLVNAVSVGEGNYGKSPLFYALTQCRDDVALLLISHGADLLIVNNKGQTPCSIAVSHLRPETCQLMYDYEASQIQAGGKFTNYRASHPDGRQYGDLDPRFEIDDDNMGDDILPELEAYNEKIQNAASNMCEDHSVNGLGLLQSTIISGLPRSVRETTRFWNIPQAERRDARKKPALNSVRGRKTEPRKDRQELDKSGSSSALDGIDIESLEPLTFGSLLAKSQPVKVVDDLDGVVELSKIIESAILMSESRIAQEIELTDEYIIGNSWGLDCEWKPAREKGHETPVATLQLSCAGTGDTFLVDVQTILQSSVKKSNVSMTKTESMLSEALAKLLGSPHIPVLGFGVGQDIGKLAASFPHIPCFHLFESVIDLHPLSRSIYPGTPKLYMCSLQKMVGILEGKRLDKTEQCSDWENRPLKAAQVYYASLDAAVLPVLLRRMLHSKEALEKYDGRFLSQHPHLRSTLRMTFLQNAPDGDVDDTSKPEVAYRIPMGSVKKHLAIHVARQIWTTGKQAPGLPELVPLEMRRSLPSDKKKREKEKEKKEKRARSPRKKTLKLINLSGDFENLPTPGAIIGFTKDLCIHQVLGQEFIESIADGGSRLGFNRRGGVIEMDNGWMLFVNFGGLATHWRYRNDFLKDGKQLTFSVHPGRDQEKSLIQFFSESGAPQVERKRVLLFARSSTKTKFMFCGQCTCIGQTEVEEDVNLVLELMDYDSLVGTSASGSGGETSYMEIVSSHTETLANKNSLLQESDPLQTEEDMDHSN